MNVKRNAKKLSNVSSTQKTKFASGQEQFVHLHALRAKQDKVQEAIYKVSLNHGVAETPKEMQVHSKFLAILDAAAKGVEKQIQLAKQGFKTSYPFRVDANMSDVSRVRYGVHRAGNAYDIIRKYSIASRRGRRASGTQERGHISLSNYPVGTLPPNKQRELNKITTELAAINAEMRRRANSGLMQYMQPRRVSNR